MTVFKGGEAIKEFLEEFDSWLSESVTVYLLGGSAMTVRGRDRSHSLFVIEIAVNSLSGLPSTFTSRIEEFGSEFEIEYTVLGVVNGGIDTVDAIRERSLRMYERCQTTRKTPTTTRLSDSLQSRFSSDGNTVQLRSSTVFSKSRYRRLTPRVESWCGVNGQSIRPAGMY